VTKQTSAADSAKEAAEAAAKAKRRAEELSGMIAKNAEAIRSAANAAYPTPRTQTTDVALAKLEEARKAIEEMRSLAKPSGGLSFSRSHFPGKALAWPHGAMDFLPLLGGVPL